MVINTLTIRYWNYYFGKADDDSLMADIKGIGTLEAFNGMGRAGEKVPVQLGLYANILYNFKATDPEKLIDVLGKDIDLEASRENIEFPELSPGEMLGNVDSNILRRLRKGVTRF
jgi:hypothetical protein